MVFVPASLYHETKELISVQCLQIPDVHLPGCIHNCKLKIKQAEPSTSFMFASLAVIIEAENVGSFL
jgi:hypothetical protein